MNGSTVIKGLDSLAHSHLGWTDEQVELDRIASTIHDRYHQEIVSGKKVHLAFILVKQHGQERAEKLFLQPKIAGLLAIERMGA